MEPSSLVLVAIIGVWAAYLVPHWLRRRDELAQSRTGDRFSGGLRVLNRRRRPAVNLSHRSGDAVLASPRVIVDADGEFLYIPADRAVAERVRREAAEAARAAAEADAAAADLVEPEIVQAAVPEAETVVEAQAVAAQAEIVVAGAESVLLAAKLEQAATAKARPGVPVHERPYDLDVAIACARIAARRRAVIMTLLLVISLSSWAVSTVPAVPGWVALPPTVLLVLHLLASRVAGLRSRETLTVFAAQLHAEELAQARPQRQVVPARPAAPAAAAAHTPDRVARRAAAVGAETWQPVPVPPPTYTLKPAVHRPEPAPLDLPAAQPAAAVSRGALPRRAAEIERILALESDLDELFQHRAG